MARLINTKNFEPSVNVKQLYLFVNHKRRPAGEKKLPGIFDLHYWEVTLIMMLFVCIFEFIGMYKLWLCLPNPLAAVVIFVFADFISAILAHLLKGKLCLAKNRKFLAKEFDYKTDKTAKHEYDRQGIIIWGCKIYEYFFDAILLSIALIKIWIFDFYCWEGGSGTLIFITLTYICVALIHIFFTGYFIFGSLLKLFLFLQKKNFEHNADSKHKVSKHRPKDIPETLITTIPKEKRTTLRLNPVKDEKDNKIHDIYQIDNLFYDKFLSDGVDNKVFQNIKRIENVSFTNNSKLFEIFQDVMTQNVIELHITPDLWASITDIENQNLSDDDYLIEFDKMKNNNLKFNAFLVKYLKIHEKWLKLKTKDIKFTDKVSFFIDIEGCFDINEIENQRLKFSKYIEAKEISNKLRLIEGIEFTEEEDFLLELKKLLGEAITDKHKVNIIKYAKLEKQRLITWGILEDEDLINFIGLQGTDEQKHKAAIYGLHEQIQTILTSPTQQGTAIKTTLN